MPNADTVYLLVSGATTAHRAPELAEKLREHYTRIILVQTPNSKQVISPFTLSRIPGIQLVEGYLEREMLPRTPVAPVVFAPCSFDSLNKLALGIADNLALSIAAEMIGLRQRVVVAVSVNEGLWAHPQTSASTARLRGWGVRVVDPEHDGNSLMMASTARVIAAVVGA